MRLTSIALLALILAGCGGDDSDLPETFQADIRRAANGSAPDTAADDAATVSADRDSPSGDERLYTVQVAAFTEPSSADELEDRLRTAGLPVWTSVTEHGGRTFYRLRVGVVPTIADARRLGSIITQRYQWPVWVAPLTPVDRLPANAVEETRRLLGTG